MLRSDGTLALGLGVAVPPPPHAATNRPAANRAGAKRASFMRTYLSDANSRCLLPEALARGESAPAASLTQGGLFPSAATGPLGKSIAHTLGFVKRSSVGVR